MGMLSLGAMSQTTYPLRFVAVSILKSEFLNLISLLAFPLRHNSSHCNKLAIANPAAPIITHKFTADPTVIEFQNKVYLYTGHDEALDNSGKYVMYEWLCFSSDDLKIWNEHPVPLRPSTFAWADQDAFASNVQMYRDKFYWFVAVTEKQTGKKAIGVAVADEPHGPFRDAKGAPLISSEDIDEGENYDPSVIIDDDMAYIFWGKEICCYSSLSDDLLTLSGEIKNVDVPDFQEGILIHRRGGYYYLLFGYQYPEKIGYAMSKSVHGPWEFKGILKEVPFNCETNRGAILHFRGEDYLFFHNGALPGGGSQRRSVCVERLFYGRDGTMSV